MSQNGAVWCGVRFHNGEAGASDRSSNAEAFGETAGESGLAGADVADELNDAWCCDFLAKFFAEI